jgi:hypothetical protein
VRVVLEALEPGLLDDLIVELKRVWTMPTGSGANPTFDEHWVLARSWPSGYIPVQRDQEVLMGASPGHVETHIDKTILGRFTMQAGAALARLQSAPSGPTAAAAATATAAAATGITAATGIPAATSISVVDDTEAADVTADEAPTDEGAAGKAAVGTSAADGTSATVDTAGAAPASVFSSAAGGAGSSAAAAAATNDRRPRVGLGPYSALLVPIIRNVAGLPSTDAYPFEAVQKAFETMNLSQLLTNLTVALRRAWLQDAADGDGGHVFDTEWVSACSHSDGDIPYYYQGDLMGLVSGGRVQLCMDRGLLDRFMNIIPELHTHVQVEHMRSHL